MCGDGELGLGSAPLFFQGADLKMKIVVNTPCGGLDPETRRPFSFAASALEIDVTDSLGKELVRAKYATQVKRPAAKKAAAKKEE